MIRKVKRVLWRKANPLKIVVHIGLHKTGSTYLQHVLNDNHLTLRDAGIYYPPRHGYPAHHHLAWELLLGKFESLVPLIDEARRAGCSQLLISSEDLEGILFDDRPWNAIRQAAKRGIAQVEFHVVLREPGRSFVSLFQELAKHTYADALALFHSVMCNGFIHMVEPGGGVPYWYYTFDHAHDLENLARRTGAKVYAHDFSDSNPFPGWRLIADHLSLLSQLPGQEARNASNSKAETIRLFEEQLARVGISKAIDLGDLDQFANGITAKFAQSHRDALDRFAYPTGANGRTS